MPDDSVEAMGTRLQRAREDADLTRQDVADETCLPISLVEAIEAGKRQLDLDTLYRLSDLYSSPVSWLLGQRYAERVGRDSPLFRVGDGGTKSRDLLVHRGHPDAWVIISATPWHGLTYGGWQRGCPTTDLPAAPAWTRSGDA